MTVFKAKAASAYHAGKSTVKVVVPETKATPGMLSGVGETLLVVK